MNNLNCEQYNKCFQYFKKQWKNIVNGYTKINLDKETDEDIAIYNIQLQNMSDRQQLRQLFVPSDMSPPSEMQYVGNSRRANELYYTILNNIIRQAGEHPTSGHYNNSRNSGHNDGAEIRNIPPGNMYGNSANLNFPGGATFIRSYNISNSGELNNYMTVIFGEILTNFQETEPNDVILPLTTDALNKLEEIKYSEYNESNKSENCAICQDHFDDNIIIKVLPCKHIFHRECISEWLQKYHHKCPICRASCGEHTAEI